MSLLLDALQRASQEKDKSSSAATPGKTPAITLEPTLPPGDMVATTGHTNANGTPDPASKPITQPEAEKPALEFSFTPQEVPAASLRNDRPAASPEIRHEPAAEAPAPAMPAPEIAAAPKSSPTAEPPRSSPTPPATQPPARDPAPSAPSRPAPPPLSPRTAREILGASAPRKRPAKRLVILASVAGVLALALGGAFLYLGLPTSSLAPQQSATVATPPAPQPAS
ncbi:MAG: hypothetical protein ACM3SV_04870, partial [Betaproteobacteria bacterium]